MSEDPAGPRVLLIDLPGADWALLHPLIDAGELPNLARLVESGCSGALQSPQPLVQPLLWNSLVSGQPAARHGVYARQWLDPETQTPEVLTARHRGAPALWEMAAASGSSATVVGGLTTHGERVPDTTIISEFFGASSIPKLPAVLENAISAAELRESLGECWMRPEEIEAEMLAFFEPDLGRVDQDKDPRLSLLGGSLSAVFSRHTAMTWLLEEHPAALNIVRYSLLDDLLHVFMPSHVGGILQPEANHLFTGVVNGAYRLLDMLIERLVELVGPQCHVLITSAAGFRVPRDREITQWMQLGREQHLRPAGVFVAAGPAIRPDALLHGAAALDVAPTVLQLLGLPISDRLPGRVLAEVFSDPPQWQRVALADPMSARGGRADRAAPDTEKDALKTYFRELGVERNARQSVAPKEQSAQISARWRWNRARALLHDGSGAQALADLEQLCEDFPDQTAYLTQLILCQLGLGLLVEARDNAQILEELAPDQPGTLLMLARIEQAAGRNQESLDLLERLRERDTKGELEVDQQLGIAQSRLRRWDDALASFQRVLEEQPNSPAAWRGSARAQLGLHQYEAAEEAALEAVGLHYQNAYSHYLLGVALQGQGRDYEANVAFGAAARFAPNWSKPHIQMLRIKRRHGASAQQLAPHREALQRNRERGDSHELLRQQMGERSTDRAEQKARLRAEMLAEGSHFEAPREPPLVAMNLLGVTGLPRAGVEAVAGILEAGGLRRFGDDDLEGRTAWELMAELPTQPRLLDQAMEQLISLPSTLLAYLPRLHHYQMIFVHRPIAEVLVSQQQALGAGDAQTELPPEESARLLIRHRDGVLTVLRNAHNIDLLEIDYSALCDEPEAVLLRIREFLGEEVLPDPAAMLRAVDPSRRTVLASALHIPESLRQAVYLDV